MIVISSDPGIWTGSAFVAEVTNGGRKWEVIDALGLETKRLVRGGKAQQVQVCQSLHAAKPIERWGKDRVRTDDAIRAWLESSTDHRWTEADVVVVEGITYQGLGGLGGQSLVTLAASAQGIAEWLHGVTRVKPYRPLWREWVAQTFGSAAGSKWRKPGAKRVKGDVAKAVERACIARLPGWGIDLGRLSKHGHVCEGAVMGRLGVMRV